MTPQAMSSEQPLLCDPKDIGTPTVRIDSFSSNIYTGSQFEALINALHVAACCAGTAVLPDHGADFPDRTVSTWCGGINGWRAASDAWLASCRHSRVLSATVRATHAATDWDASPQQLLGLLTDGWNHTVKFAPARTMCVNVTARQTVRAKSAR